MISQMRSGKRVSSESWREPRRESCAPSAGPNRASPAPAKRGEQSALAGLLPAQPLAAGREGSGPRGGHCLCPARSWSKDTRCTRLCLERPLAGCSEEQPGSSTASLAAEKGKPRTRGQEWTGEIRKRHTERPPYSEPGRARSPSRRRGPRTGEESGADGGVPPALYTRPGEPCQRPLGGGGPARPSPGPGGRGGGGLFC